VLIALCDRILVIGSGRITGVVDGRSATKEEIGFLMTKHSADESQPADASDGEENGGEQK